MAFLKKLALILLFTWAALVPGNVRAEEVRLQEAQVKAGLLYNFLKYTEWPAEALQDSIEVCVAGGDPFNGYLASLEKMTVKLKPIRVRYLSPSNISGCHLLYLNAGSRSAWPQLRAQAQRQHTLTISDYDGFTQEGGIIEFGRKNNRVSATLNTSAAKKAGLKIGGRLLNLVTVVGGAE